jgi:hypothetical protein
MTQVVFVTNRSNTVLRDGYGGVFYDFVKDKTVQVPLNVAQHVFGYGKPDKEPFLARLGWIKSHADLQTGLELLAQFDISEQQPEQNRSLPSAVSVVPLRVEKPVGGKVTQRAA